MGHDIGDPPVHQQVDEERFTAERRDCVKRASHLAERPLHCCDFGHMTELTGHAEILRIGKLRPGKDFVEDFERSALMS